MEGDLLFSCPFMEFGSHAADRSHLRCSSTSGALFGLASPVVCSAGNVLDTVSEDPIAELEDSMAQPDADVNLYPDTVNTSCIDVFHENHAMVPPLFSTSKTDSTTPLTLDSFDGFEDPLKQLLSDMVNLMNVNDADGVNMNVMGINNANIATESIMNGDAGVLQGSVRMEDAMPAVSKPLISVEQTSQGLNGFFSSSLINHSAALAAEPFLLPATSISNARKVSMAHMLDALTTHDVVNDASSASFQRDMISFLSGLENKKHELLPDVSTQNPQVQLPHAGIQRSFSSHALGQLGKRNFPFGPEGLRDGALNSKSTNNITAPWLNKTAPLCSSSTATAGGLAPVCPKVQPFDPNCMQSFLSSGSIRKVYSTGDLQTMKGLHFVQEATSPPNPPLLEERSLKVRKYTQEERKNRIFRYRQKRNERNFSKTIKYACRKTLADSRPRVRGRFARNDDSEDTLYHSNGVHAHDDEDDETLWHHPQVQFGYWLQE